MPKPQARVGGDGTVRYTVPGEEVRLVKQFTATFKFRVSKEMESGEGVRFNVEVGDGTGTIELVDEVGMYVK